MRGRGRGPGGPPHPGGGHPRGPLRGVPRGFLHHHPGPPPLGAPPRPRRSPLLGLLLRHPPGVPPPREIFPVGYSRVQHRQNLRRFLVTLPPDVVVGEEITVLIDGQHIDIVAPDYVGEVVVAIPIETSEGFGTVVRSGDSSTATEALLSDAPGYYYQTQQRSTSARTRTRAAVPLPSLWGSESESDWAWSWLSRF